MQTKDLIFNVPYAIIGSWTENHVNSGNASERRIFCTSFTGGLRNNQYATRKLLTAFSATSGLSEKDRKHEKKVNRMKQITLHKIVDSSNCSPVITIKNGHATTTSRNVAIVFGKRHDRVIDAIRNLTTSTPTEFSQHNFVSAAYRDGQGKSRPMYELTRDGFTLLAMGFTGKRALEFKLAYINAFNEMERKLAEPKNRLTHTDKNAIIGSEIQTSETTVTSPHGVFFTPVCWECVNILNKRSPSFRAFETPSTYPADRWIQTKETKMNNLLSNQESLVSIKHNTVITTSKQIAITFGKPHCRVMESVRNLATSTPTEFGQSNFRLSSYNNSQGKRQPMYELTRDGFTLLAMGFTGKRALEFKLAYINAFNEMERKLAEAKTITVKSHTRRVPRKTTTKELPAPVTDNVRGDSLYEKMKLIIVASEFFDKAMDATDRAKRLSDAIDCMASAYNITNRIKEAR